MKNKKNLSRLVVTLLLCFIQFTVFSQVKTVTGKVTEEDGAPLTGVTVIIKGTTTGTTTDMDGNYSLSFDNEDAILVYSFIGYATEEIPAIGQTVINIILKEEATELEEIVVIGYGTTKKSDLTGSLASLKEDDFNTGVITSPEQLIQGRVPGVQITSNSGEPGAGASILIRGSSSIRSGQKPLYVVDGVPLDMQNTSPDAISAQGFSDGSPTNPMNFINPSDIESIDILKDASAAAIYGSRGANGVIIITTKKGKEGKSELDYSTYLSISQVPKKLDVLTADEFVFWRDSLWDVGVDDPSHYGYSTDWQDEIFRTGISQNHSLSIAGGTANNTYRASFNYLDQEGIIEKSSLSRYTGRINVTQKAIKDRLYLEANITASQMDENRLPIGSRTGFEGDLIINALQANPTWPVYDSTGAPFQVNQQNKRNPVAMLEYTEDKTKTNRVLASIAANLEILKGLNYKINFGVDNSVAVRRIDQSRKLNYLVSDNGRADINNRELNTYVIEHTLTYSKTFADIHKIEALAGFSYQHFLIRGYNIGTRGYESDEVLYTNNLEASSTSLSQPSSYAVINEMQSVFGRINYNLMEKYLLTATIRRDGSSKFGEDVKYGNFPSFAFAWRLSQEDFISNLNVFNNLKLRIGWGQTGNQEIGEKHSLFSLSAEENAKAVLDGSSITQGYVLTKTPTPNVTWETTTSTNIGLDFGFFKGRLSGTADYFTRKTTNMLIEVPSKQPAPTNFQLINVAQGYILNNGIELGITGVAVSTSDINLDVNVTFTKINNVVKDIPVTRIATGSASGQGMTGVLVQVYTNDEPMNTFYGYKHLGFDSTGRSIYEEGVSELDTLLLLGSPLPDYSWSVNTSFRYKNIDLSIFVEAVNGNLIYNNTANSIGVMGNLYQANNTFQSTVELPESRRNSMRFSDRFLEDGSYIRLSSVTIGYNLPVTKISWISKLRFYVSGSNLLVLTDYSGFDPDVTNTPGALDAYNSIGIDNSSYPKPRTYLFGLNVAF